MLYCTRKRQRAQDRIGSSRQSGFAADRSYKRGPIVEIRQINIRPERATEPYFASARTEAVDYGLFVLLHEIGHSFLAGRQVPFLGREEDAADEIAALLAIDRHFPDIIDAGARFFALEVTNGGASDDHSDPARRAYRVRCLAYGSDPQRFASWSSQTPRKADDQSCRLLYQAQHANWIQILRYAKARNVRQQH